MKSSATWSQKDKGVATSWKWHTYFSYLCRAIYVVTKMAMIYYGISVLWTNSYRQTVSRAFLISSSVSLFSRSWYNVFMAYWQRAQLLSLTFISIIGLSSGIWDRSSEKKHLWFVLVKRIVKFFGSIIDIPQCARMDLNIRFLP